MTLQAKYLAAIIVLTLAGALPSQELITARTDSLIRAGIKLSIEQSFVEALDVFSSLEREMPENPVGYFFHAAALQLEMMDYENYSDDDEFVSLIHKTIDLTQSRLEAGEKDPWTYFFQGSSYGYLAFHHARKNEFAEAFQHGMRGINVLEATLRADSTLYDVYLALGMYKYYRSKLSRHLSWLPFVKDERAEAIRMLRIAMSKSRYSRYSAMNSFCWIALEEENYEEGWQVVNTALKEIPHSRVFLWCAAKLAAKLELWQESIGYYEEILVSLKKQGTLLSYNELICRKNLFYIYATLENDRLALQQCRRIAQIRRQNQPPPRSSDILREMEDPCADYSEETVIGGRRE